MARSLRTSSTRILKSLGWSAKKSRPCHREHQNPKVLKSAHQNGERVRKYQPGGPQSALIVTP